MRLNGIAKLKDERGDFLVLTDYGPEGLSVSYQTQSVDDAIQWILDPGAASGPHAIVQFVRVWEPPCAEDIPASATAIDLIAQSTERAANALDQLMALLRDRLPEPPLPESEDTDVELEKENAR